MCCGDRHGKLGYFHSHESGAETYPNDEERYCICPGYKVEYDWENSHRLIHNITPYDGPEITPENVANKGKCCGAATADDHLCDRCREHCKGIIEEVKEKGSLAIPEDLEAYVYEED